MFIVLEQKQKQKIKKKSTPTGYRIYTLSCIPNTKNIENNKLYLCKHITRYDLDENMKNKNKKKTDKIDLPFFYVLLSFHII